MDHVQQLISCGRRAAAARWYVPSPIVPSAQIEINMDRPTAAILRSQDIPDGLQPQHEGVQDA